jgi:hypothetical protein
MMKVTGWLAVACCVGLSAAACGAGDSKKVGRGEGGEGGEPVQAEAGDGGMAVSAGGGEAEQGGAEAGGAGGAATSAAGAGGVEGDGSQQVEEGPPGTVGNPCTAEGACLNDLVCAASAYCQPGESALPSEIVQAVPLPDSANIPSQAPIVLFADGTYGAVSFTVVAHTLDGVEDITAQVSVVKLTSASGNDVYVLAAKGGLPLGASVVVSLTGDITGVIVFNVDHASPPYADGALDFEGDTATIPECAGEVEVKQLPLGWTAFGDLGAIAETGTVLPTSGTQTMAMSTGAVLCGQALGDTSSMLVSGPIRDLGESPALDLDYNFQSSEFDDYCDTEYDDTLIGVLSGPNGAVATVIDSVNLICQRAMHAAGAFPGLPDGGDDVYKQTGNLPFTLQGDVGSPAVLAFVLTDVGDTSLSSLASIDNIRLHE